MVSRDGRYVLIYNGEIYNYIELREILGAWSSISNSGDTEVVSNHYSLGSEAFSKFNGMWALILFDTTQGRSSFRGIDSESNRFISGWMAKGFLQLQK
jgi:asparagine synthase (glutamine-hydrolysing)